MYDTGNLPMNTEGSAVYRTYPDQYATGQTPAGYDSRTVGTDQAYLGGYSYRQPAVEHFLPCAESAVPPSVRNHSTSYTSRASSILSQQDSVDTSMVYTQTKGSLIPSEEGKRSNMAYNSVASSVGPSCVGNIMMSFCSRGQGAGGTYGDSCAYSSSRHEGTSSHPSSLSDVNAVKDNVKTATCDLVSTSKSKTSRNPKEYLDKPEMNNINNNRYDAEKFEQLAQEEVEFEEDVDSEFTDEDIGEEDCNLDDVAQRLLKFADMVNRDIHKYFGRRTEEDSCDIYEDKWTSGKSGRELYYADIMRLAQGGDEDEAPTREKTKKHTGKSNKKIGLGPLDSLFDIIKGMDRKRGKVKKSKKRFKSKDKSNEIDIPMLNRKLPESFWNEPNIDLKEVNQSNKSKYKGKSKSIAEHSPKFTQLLDGWEGTTVINSK